MVKGRCRLSSWKHERALVGALSRSRPDTDPAAAARLNLRAEVLANHVQRVVDQAPPLTSEQRERIAAILRGPDDLGRA